MLVIVLSYSVNQYAPKLPDSYKNKFSHSMITEYLCSYFVFCLLINLICSYPTSICPNRCSKHGICTNSSVGVCECFPGYGGNDCSVRLCPASTAWVDIPFADNSAHAELTECSNMGTCDRKTGTCQCRSGFGGAACEKMLCPTGVLTSSLKEFSGVKGVCSGNGRCLSLREITDYQDYKTNFGYSKYQGWDADMIHGCVCDEGWEGVACDKRSCPKGDDPLTIGYDDIQIIDCMCTRCKGGMYISYQGYETPFIPYNAGEEIIAYRLSQIPTIKKVRVNIVQGATLCSTEGSVTEISIILPQGPKDSLTISLSGGLEGHYINNGAPISVRSQGQISIVSRGSHTSVRGTKEYIACSNHGECDYTQGVCNCYSGYKSSDGLGKDGDIGDCGYQYEYKHNYTLTNNTHVVTRCPALYGALCSGNGTCNELTGLCECDDGYGGPACANKTCITTHTWFGDVDDYHQGYSICGGIGDCDSNTGLCKNCGGNWGTFYGDGCQYLSCYSDDSGTCGGNGACLSLRDLAGYSYNDQKELRDISYDTQWDADLIHGCLCERAISVDNQFDPEYYHKIVSENTPFNFTTNSTTGFDTHSLTKFYRGPYAYAATDFKGYNCKQALCPKGDNPKYGGYNEIQQLNCHANNGSFTLTFRENTTLPISINTTAHQLEHYLEQLYTIGDVLVYTNNGGRVGTHVNTSICNEFNNITVYIEFLTEFGDLPLIRANTQGIDSVGYGIDLYYNSYAMNITEYQKGTKSDLECSAHGICDEDTGICDCFEGFGSSNGTSIQAGQRGDCTFYNPFYTQKFLKK